MTGDPHSQLVPTSPIWSQLDPTSTKKSVSQLPRSWCIQNPRDLQLLLLPTFQNYDVVLAMVGANTRAKNKQNCTMICTIHGNCQCWLMVCGPHNPAGQGKNHGPAPTVCPTWETENVQNLLGFVTFWWNALCATKLEAQPSPIQMLRPHATSRQWFMQISWQAQWKLMDDSLVYLH